MVSAMDKFSKEKRSEIMAKIRSKETKFERDFATKLKRSTSKRFKTNVSYLEGKPDIVFTKEKIAIFLDSDFWHGWQYSRWKSSLNDFWRSKIESNRKRDRKVTSRLRKAGWTVARIWGHEVSSDPDKAVSRVIDLLA